MEGTYPLPEAQVDRFLFKLLVEFPSQDELCLIFERTTGLVVPRVEKVCGADDLAEMQLLARDIEVAPEVRRAIALLVRQTHPELPEAPEAVKRYVRYGSSPRGGQALLLAAKARALSLGRFNVALEDLQSVGLACLRHRLIASFEAEAEGVTADQVLTPMLQNLRLEVGV
jgi:MoxR-like ATPase